MRVEIQQSRSAERSAHAGVLPCMLPCVCYYQLWVLPCACYYASCASYSVRVATSTSSTHRGNKCDLESMLV